MANSWKKYGGIYKSDKYNNIGVGTMVADQVLIRQRVITSSQVAGSLTVGENTEIGIDLTVKQNANIVGDLYVQKSEYVNDKIYFNTNTDTNNNYIAYIKGNSKLGRIGIGTTAPKSFLDINVSNSLLNSGTGGSTIGNTITEVLTVRNSNNYIRNIIAQNVHKSGVVVDTSGNIASIGFYNKNVDISTSIPPISMTADASNQIFTIQGKDNNIISNAITISSETITNILSNDNNIFSNNNTTISSDTDTFIKSVNNIVIDTSNNAIVNTDNDLIITTGNISKINSIMSISKRSVNEQLLNGTITIYDNSATIFLNDYYADDSVKSGNAITIVSNDNSSNAFIDIVTPDEKGLYIGGGAYPFDTSRSMGTIGVPRTDVSYIPTQVIISNTDQEYKAKYRTSVGFNTYSPESNKYMMDINGLTRIGNGEMHIRSHTNFQALNIHFSKQNKKFGVIFGSPYESTGQIARYNALITNDSSVTWTTTNNLGPLDINRFTTTNYDKLYAYCINNKEFFYISTISSAIIGYGKVNLITDVNDSNNINYTLYTSASGRNFKTLCVSSPETNNYKVLIGGTYTNVTTKSVIYYYIINTISSENSLNDPASIDASCSIIRHCDFDVNSNIAYFVGDGIEKIDFTLTIPRSVLYKNSANSYNKVYVYDENYVVAVGNSIISYTRDGGNNWTDVSITNFNNDPYPSDKPYPNYKTTDSYETFNLTNIDLIDNINGIATGTFVDADGIDRPLIICTKDGSNTWNRMNPKTFYSFGVGHYIENTSLNCIVPSSKDNYVLINNVTDSTNSPSFIAGKSNIIYGYLPNLFNVFTNQVVDINGGMNVDGKIWQF